MIDPQDARARRVGLTRSGIAKLQEVRGPYYRLLSRIFRDSDGKALRDQVAFLDTVRSRITETLRAG